MLALVVVRPRRWNEGWWTMLGAAAMLALYGALDQVMGLRPMRKGVAL